MAIFGNVFNPSRPAPPRGRREYLTRRFTEQTPAPSTNSGQEIYAAIDAALVLNYMDLTHSCDEARTSLPLEESQSRLMSRISIEALRQQLSLAPDDKIELNQQAIESSILSALSTSRSAIFGTEVFKSSTQNLQRSLRSANTSQESLTLDPTSDSGYGSLSLSLRDNVPLRSTKRHVRDLFPTPSTESKEVAPMPLRVVAPSSPPVSQIETPSLTYSPITPVSKRSVEKDDYFSETPCPQPRLESSLGVMSHSPDCFLTEYHNDVLMHDIEVLSKTMQSSPPIPPRSSNRPNRQATTAESPYTPVKTQPSSQILTHLYNSYTKSPQYLSSSKPSLRLGNPASNTAPQTGAPGLTTEVLQRLHASKMQERSNAIDLFLRSTAGSEANGPSSVPCSPNMPSLAESRRDSSASLSETPGSSVFSVAFHNRTRNQPSLRTPFGYFNYAADRANGPATPEHFPDTRMQIEYAMRECNEELARLESPSHRPMNEEQKMIRRNEIIDLCKWRVRTELAKRGVDLGEYEGDGGSNSYERTFFHGFSDGSRPPIVRQTPHLQLGRHNSTAFRVHQNGVLRRADSSHSTLRTPYEPALSSPLGSEYKRKKQSGIMGKLRKGAVTAFDRLLDPKRPKRRHLKRRNN